MWLWITKTIIISLIFIVILHNLFTFLKTTLTVPKLKDFVNKPTEKYNNILETINNTPDNKSNNTITDTNNTMHMKDELSTFLNSLNSKSTDNATPIGTNTSNMHDSMSNINGTNINSINSNNGSLINNSSDIINNKADNMSYMEY